MSRWIKPQTLKDVQKMTKERCANYSSNGTCLVTGNQCRLFRELLPEQQLERCVYFETAVLPNDPALEHQYNQQLDRWMNSTNEPGPSGNPKMVGRCDGCGQSFKKRSNSQKYCFECRDDKARETSKLAMRRLRQSKTDL